MTYESVRGMRDLLPEEIPYWTSLEGKVREVARRFHYREIRTPLVEHTELFSHGIGEATDVVGKEMYTFPDKKGRSLTLRPEGTASVVRAYVEHGLFNREPFQKLFYVGPMFRYEKPQKGRSRQFHQCGVEAIGSLDPALDAEVVSLAWSLIASLGLSRLSLRLNSIGCAADRATYREALRAHFAPHLSAMCPDCQRRYDENPLRILDCKEEPCRAGIEAAPGTTEHLCPDCASHFARLERHLEALHLDYTLDPRLVRGLDYYTRTVFELVSADLGAQDALLGGGRYDDLVERLGGPPTPAVGFAAGMDRLILVLQEQASTVERAAGLDLFLATTGEETAASLALSLAQDLRRRGLSIDLDYRARSLKKQIGDAADRGASHLIVLGGTEVAARRAKLRNLATRIEEEVALTSEAIAERLRER